jgi:hypothetical protein
MHVWQQQRLPASISDEAGEAMLRLATRMLPIVSTYQASHLPFSFSLWADWHQK